MREQIQQEEKQEEQEEDQIDDTDKRWDCSICTYLNLWTESICEVCQAPRPINYQQKYQKQKEDIKQNDLNDIIKLKKQKDQNRFDKIIGDIHMWVQNYYEGIKTQKQKEVQQLETEIQGIEGQIKKQKEKIEKKNRKTLKQKVINNDIIDDMQQQIKQNQSQIDSLNGWINDEFYNQECLIFCGKNIISEIREKEFEQILVNRLRNDKGMKQVIKDELKKQNISQEVIIRLQELVDKGEGVKAYQLLQEYGFDFWMQKSGIGKQDKQDIHIGLNNIKLLKEYVELELAKETRTVLTYQGQSIRFPKDSETLEVEVKQTINMEQEMQLGSNKKVVRLRPIELSQIRFQWEVIKMFNQRINDCSDLIDFPEFIDNNRESEREYLKLGEYLSRLRDIQMNPVKVDLTQKILQKTAVEREHIPQVNVERISLSIQQQNQHDNYMLQKQNTIEEDISMNQTEYKEIYQFTKAYEQLKNVQLSMLRPNKPKGSEPFMSFGIVLQGELVMGESGPYRQFFADISQELVGIDQQLKLFIRSPNDNESDDNNNTNTKFIINPSAISTYQLQLFEFLGILFGVCIRTGVHFTLDLPKIFWKQLVGQQISIDDLQEVDLGFYNFIEYIRDSDQDVFDELSQHYNVDLSNKQKQELLPEGNTIKVEYKDRQQYIKMLFEARMKENQEQIINLRNGLLKVVPQSLLNNIGWQDIQVWVAGKREVDFGLLRRYTRYADGLTEDSDIVQYLWEVLDGFTHSQAIKFVKFCWGQERLPANDDEFQRTQTRFLIKKATHYSLSKKDQAFPKSDICFFNLQLPEYSSKDILRDKVLTVIYIDCDSLNGDDLVNLDPNAQNDRRDELFFDDDEYRDRYDYPNEYNDHQEFE